MTGRRGDGRRPGGPGEENPLAELLEDLKRDAWRPAKTSWSESERRRRETERRNEELMVAWRKRHIRPAPSAEREEEDRPDDAGRDKDHPNEG